MASFSTQSGNVQNIAVAEGSGNAVLTQTYGVPPEQKEAVEAVKRKLEPELQKEEPSVASILNDLTDLALKNAPAFLAMVRLWFGK